MIMISKTLATFSVFLMLSSISTFAGPPFCEQLLDKDETINGQDPPSYSIADFPTSTFWRKSSSDQGGFSLWAAEMANLSANVLRREKFADVLAIIAEQRQDLDRGQSPLSQQNNPFGRSRTEDLRQVTHLAALNKLLFPESEWRELNRVQFFYLARSLHKHTESDGITKAAGQGKFYLTPDHNYLAAEFYVEMPYSDPDHKEWPCTSLTLTREGLFSIWHPTGPVAQKMLKDITSEINRMLRSRSPTKAQFAGVMHSYFNAMPFKRGSAAIGRAIFAGLYLRLFGEPLRVPTDIDLHALLRTRQQFIQFFEESLKQKVPA